MKAKDKISRAAWNLVSGVRDSTVDMLVSAIRDEKIKVDKNSVPLLVDLVGKSIEAGYHKAHAVFNRELDGILFDEVNDAVNDAKKNS